jgi:hypothetical protein
MLNIFFNVQNGMTTRYQHIFAFGGHMNLDFFFITIDNYKTCSWLRKYQQTINALETRMSQVAMLWSFYVQLDITLAI